MECEGFTSEASDLMDQFKRKFQKILFDTVIRVAKTKQKEWADTQDVLDAISLIFMDELFYELTEDYDYD